jgi:DNA integrity scanning protein DisA with diadenylate cyclase activity
MDRKEFLIVAWLKLFKPILLIGVLIFSIRFLIRIFSQDDIERLISVIVLGLVILSALSYLFGLVFKNITNRIKSKMPEKSLDNFRIVGKVLNYLIPIALGIVIYYTWQRDGISALTFFGAFLIFQIIEIVRKEKLATTRNKKNRSPRSA